jgi:hypothetical protein
MYILDKVVYIPESLVQGRELKITTKSMNKVMYIGMITLKEAGVFYTIKCAGCGCWKGLEIFLFLKKSSPVALGPIQFPV